MQTNDTPSFPTAIRALSNLSGVSVEEVTIQVASLLSAVGGHEAGLITSGDGLLPVGFHLLHLGGDSARQRHLTQLMFQPLRYLRDVPLEYRLLFPSWDPHWISPFFECRSYDESSFVDPDPERIEGTSGLLESRCINKPLHFFDNPAVGALMKSWEGFDHDSPRMILDESGRLWEGACESASDFEALHHVLMERAFKNPAASGEDRNRSGCSRLFSVVTEKMGRRLLTEPEMDGLVASLLVVGPPSGEDTTGCEIDLENVSTGYRCFHDTLTALAELRRFDALDLRKIIMHDVVWNEFYWGIQSLMERLKIFDSATRHFTAPFSNLPVSILWTLARLEPTRVVHWEMVSTALALAEAAMRNHLVVIRELRRDAETVRIDPSLTATDPRSFRGEERGRSGRQRLRSASL